MTVSTGTPEPTNQHFSVDPDGKPVLKLFFVSEPLGLPASEGYGWPQLQAGEFIGPENRYQISRKLGWGMSSSTWLARDQQENKFVAIKSLNGYYTDLIEKGLVWELEALKVISEQKPASPHCLKLFSTFKHPGKGTSGQHVCFVTQLLGGDVNALWKAGGGKPFPLPLAKRILLHTLRGLHHAHQSGVVHTDLKHDNIFFDTGMTTEEIEDLIASDPPRVHPPEQSKDGIVQAAVSQPLPVPSWDEAMKRNFVVADFGNAQRSTDPKIEEVTSRPLRPPEIYIGGPWSEKVDIWTFGCLIFEIAMGKTLFTYKANLKYQLDETESMLHQMLCFTGEDFEPEQLSTSGLASKYFDGTCNLRKHPDLFDYPFELSIENSKVLENEADIKATAAIMTRCLRLDPAMRASAAELLLNPWFSGVE